MSNNAKTVRVRILVAIDRNGKYSASGMSDVSDDDNHGNLFLDYLDDDEAYHWVEADVPIPSVIIGAVTPDDAD